MTAALLALAALIFGGAWLWTPDLPLAELEARYGQPPSQRVEVDGVPLHVRDSGPAPGAAAPATPVLLLHGFGASLHTWEPWAAELQRQRRVLRLDLPGAGLTGADPSGDYSDARSLQLLLALLDRLGLAQVDLVGHSMGGRLAWRLAAEHPVRVRRLVLIAPDGFASPGFEYGKPPEVGFSVRLMKRVLPRALVRASLEPAYANPALLTEDTVTRYHELLLAPGVRGALIARMEQLVLQEPTPWLRRVQAPTLLMWGEKDAMIPATNAEDYLRVMPQARLVVLPQLGHLPHEEGPAQSLLPLQAFLSD